METKRRNEYELSYFNLFFRHKNLPCVVCGHGGSLNKFRQLIEILQIKKKILRISVNNWWDFFVVPPDYMVTANTEGQNSIRQFCHRLNQIKTTTALYANSVDITPLSFVRENATFPFMGYDQRHFLGQDCTTIYNDFLTYTKTHPGTDFKDFLIYGTSEQWKTRGPYYGFWPKGATIAFPDFPDCCSQMRTQLTVQEQLQRVSGHATHYSPGDSGALHAIAFAILMGCNPIYLAGIDLDYRKKYATTVGGSEMASPPANTLDDNVKSIIQDLTIIKESAERLNIKIYDLSNCHLNVFEKKDTI